MLYGKIVAGPLERLRIYHFFQGIVRWNTDRSLRMWFVNLIVELFAITKHFTHLVYVFWVTPPTTELS